MIRCTALRAFAFVLIAGIVFVAGCRKDATPPAAAPAHKPTVELLGEKQIKKELLNARATTIDGIDPNSLWALLVSTVVNVYKVTYPTTDPDGVPVDASGLLVIPKDRESVSLISFQNGTVFDPKQAASFFNPDGPLHYWIPVAAALGSAVIVPDYLGYGNTANIPHPYQHAASLARTSADMIIAVKQWLEEQHIQWDKKLFLAGYSEGGYATMALHRLLQEQYATQLPVTAASYGAGAYDITSTARYFLERDEDRDSFYIRSHIWVLTSFNRIYHLNRPLNTFLKAPYDVEVATRPISQAVLPLNPAQLLNPVFKANVLNGNDTQLLNILSQNDIYDWKPLSPVLLIHSDADRNVPIFNSDRAYAGFKSKGVDAEYLIIPGKSHQDAIPDFALNSLLYFARYQ
ncbi:alpha/beta hydrolase family protein [Chitinophaga nivalis]|uniref:Prolyl oligopeptidase family serine peptidase n=1 Tax=Chitinophaga nivalis TaxID=2991709 RepID=A0ABT3IIP6_9BACT|nr:alpha/beta fold hydrolase [Chitinophaga nivalis]MCW3466685.1 prolyl oligopeptidase family serine peptidase [Chitinophaga nivalis]MCW3483624.1 prolyl oligopeptidase family serine peptidase [Chitinophaga nivalis]